MTKKSEPKKKSLLPFKRKPKDEDVTSEHKALVDEALKEFDESEDTPSIRSPVMAGAVDSTDEADFPPPPAEEAVSATLPDEAVVTEVAKAPFQHGTNCPVCGAPVIGDRCEIDGWSA